MISKWFTTRAPKLKPDQKFDPQRRRCYHMERRFDGLTIVCVTPRKHLEDIIKHACNKHKVPRPKLIVGRSRKKLLGYCSDEHIWLNASFYGKNIVTLLHELSHWIVEHQFEDYHDHGPEFMCIYGQMLDAYRILPLFAFRKLCKDLDIKIARLPSPY